MPGAALMMDRMVLCVAFLVLMASFRGGARAQSPSPPSSPPKKAPATPPPLAVPPKAPLPPEEPCSKVIFKSLLPCVPYVTPKSNETNPDPNCCDGFRKFLHDRSDCVCLIINSNSSLPIPVDRVKAFKLPNACNATIPPIDRCLRPGRTAASPAPPPSNAANPSLVPSAATFLAGISLAIVTAVL